MDALLGAIWLYATDVPRTVAFFRDQVGLRPLEEDGQHFDAGNIRLSIHAAREDRPQFDGAFYVFIVKDISSAVEELSTRGVAFEGGVTEEEFGRIAGFRDPDGHEFYLWQIPPKDDPAHGQIRPLAEHYSRLRAALT
jgi:predicted enzyme related to lactoylglutathione lyase